MVFLKALRRKKLFLSNCLMRLCSQLLVIAALAQIPHSLAAQQEKSLSGRLLVALPEMKDPRFAETVIYIVKHDREGVFGLVVNRPLATAPIAEVLAGLGIDGKIGNGEIVIHYGGPVGARQGFVLHSDDFMLENSTKITQGIAVTSDPAIIREISLGKGPGQFLLLIGYAGWAPGQLERELQAKAWFSIPADKELIFAKQAEKKWQRAIDKRQVPL
jgi:putative transcriptional regulator